MTSDPCYVCSYWVLLLISAVVGLREFTILISIPDYSEMSVLCKSHL